MVVIPLTGSTLCHLCLMPNELIFSHIMTRASYISMSWWWCLLCTWPPRLISSLYCPSLLKSMQRILNTVFFWSVSIQCPMRMPYLLDITVYLDVFRIWVHCTKFYDLVNRININVNSENLNIRDIVGYRW